ncbi:trypsin-like peptidase domain-containing protein, partial [Janibacter melonis]|uniref:S1C family serine protease n=1 Tax=Janibacter melonis TaxID=262209 RepID=UPI00177FE0A0|nr:PDZ domain-containing protein [Janibacter melonis]
DGEHGEVGRGVRASDRRGVGAAVREGDGDLRSRALAVLTITDPPKELTPITFGASDSLAVGDPVMAIGNPLGLSGTVTTGVVSALDRPVSTSDSSSQDPFAQGQGETVVTNAVQTSAAINPGNSGGALVDASGRLVGINSSIASTGSSSGGQSGSIGIGFAIPVDQARMIADQLITDGSAQHAFLGVTPSDGTAKSGSATRSGAKIEQVSQGSGAAKAGLEVGDLVVAVGDTPVTSAESLVAHVREEAVGSTVKLTVIRDGKSTQVDVTLGERTEG